MVVSIRRLFIVRSETGNGGDVIGGARSQFCGRATAASKERRPIWTRKMAFLGRVSLRQTTDVCGDNMAHASMRQGLGRVTEDGQIILLPLRSGRERRVG